MRLIKTMLRSILPHGLVERRRHAISLKQLGIRGTHLSSSETYEAVHNCRFALWPSALRQSDFGWALVDVGANIGEYVSSALTLVSPQMVIAIEPQPSCH